MASVSRLRAILTSAFSARGLPNGEQEFFEELMAHHREMTATDSELESAGQKSLDEVAADFHPSKMAASEALRQKHQHLESITYFAHQFGGKVLDISTNSCIVEM